VERFFPQLLPESTMATTDRLLRLLALLQSHRRWRGVELAGRLGVTTRTLRNDLARLRDLGYEIRSTTGPDGGYELRPGTALPPLLLDDEEAVAVAVGLRAAASGSVSGIEETSLRALAKLEQTMPSRLSHRVAALRSVTESAAARGPTVDTEVLTAVAAAAERRERLRFDYVSHDGGTSRRDVEPYRLVYTGRRWYLLAWDTSAQDWRTFRADRITPRIPSGPRFTPRDLPDGGAAAHVLRGVSTRAFPAPARVRLYAPVEVVAERIAPVGGVLTAIDEHTCELETAGPSLFEVAGYVASLDVPFEILAPPELHDVAARMARRLAAAAVGG
jgi:predicted DNA-binding transcriptional regulator YafY